MSTVDVLDKTDASLSGDRPHTVNDFSIVVATVNGSGSQTANGLLVRAAFKMGIPVNSKNLFPSNISGLPTWYIIRLSKEGYAARREESEILVAFNPATAEEDLANVPPGGVCIYPDDLQFANPRTDVTMYAVPAKDIMKQAEIDPKLRDHVRNMVYVGALAYLLGFEVEVLREGLMHHFKGKVKPVDMNMDIVQKTLDW